MTNEQIQTGKILSKNKFGNYTVESGSRIKIFSNWELVVAEAFLPKEDDLVFVGQIKKKGVELHPHDDVCQIFCLYCGEPFSYPVDSDSFPVFCDGRCKFNFELENEVKKENDNN